MDGEEVELSSADGTKIKAFVILARDKPEERPTVLLLHANAGNVVRPALPLEDCDGPADLEDGMDRVTACRSRKCSGRR